MRSHKEQAIDNKIIKTLESFNLTGKALSLAKLIINDDEVQAIQEYANTVSIVRLGINDHGPVHMRIVVQTILKMAKLLKDAGIKTNLEKEEIGSFEDSLMAMMLAAMFHDAGMSIGRQEHERHSAYIAYPIISKLMADIYKEDIYKQVIIRSIALEGISGHMGNRTIHSLEAGLVQVADGCDMTKGRARIPMAINDIPKTGHIHQYSASSIEKVNITAGKEKPIRIDVSMSSEVGLFQVEEVLLVKIAASTAKPYIELYAKVREEEAKQYL